MTEAIMITVTIMTTENPNNNDGNHDVINNNDNSNCIYIFAIRDGRSVCFLSVATFMLCVT